MVILELPVFEIVTVCGADEVAVVMLPKLRLVGLMLSVRVAAIPVPLSVTEVGEVGALLTIEMFPVTARQLRLAVEGDRDCGLLSGIYI